jgi:DNA-binding MarR family transcriptional regulator
MKALKLFVSLTIRYALSVSDEAPRTDREILTLVWVVRELERACTDLTLPQYRLLALIVGGEERASGLAGQLALARPTVSAAVETLVTNGMVERTTVDNDRRAIRLTITQAGRRALEAAESAMREKLDALMRDVRDPEVVADALDQLASALAAQGERARAARGAAAGDLEVTATR